MPIIFNLPLILQKIPPIVQKLPPNVQTISLILKKKKCTLFLKKLPIIFNLPLILQTFPLILQKFTSIGHKRNPQVRSRVGGASTLPTPGYATGWEYLAKYANVQNSRFFKSLKWLCRKHKNIVRSQVRSRIKKNTSPSIRVI